MYRITGNFRIKKITKITRVSMIRNFLFENHCYQRHEFTRVEDRMAGSDASLFTMESAVRGYHVYQTIWSSRVGEQLECRCEDHNIHDMYAVAVMKPGIGVVGHLPRRISTPCNRFIENHGTITCIVTGSRRYSADLEQGGLEIPAKLIFEGGEEMIDQVRLLIQNAPSEPISRSTLPELIPKPRNKSMVGFSNAAAVIEVAAESSAIACADHEALEQHQTQLSAEISITLPDVTDEGCTAKTELKDCIWVRFGRSTLLLSDKDALLTSGVSLTDKHINFALALFRDQHPEISGFLSTLQQYKPLPKRLQSGLQIIHSRACHWVTAFKKKSTSDVVVYDSMFDSIDHVVETVVTNIFGTSKITMSPMQKQSAGGNNCGLFAVATCMALLLKQNPSEILFDEEKMIGHLFDCFEKHTMTNFPECH